MGTQKTSIRIIIIYAYIRTLMEFVLFAEVCLRGMPERYAK